MSTNEANALPSIPAVADDRPPIVPISLSIDGDLAPTYILPKRMYIRDRYGRYLSVRQGPGYHTLTFRRGDPDITCAFEAYGYFWYQFQGSNQERLMRYYSGWYSCDSNSAGGAANFQVITSTENYVYLKDNYGPSLFVSCDQNESGSPVGLPYINDSSRFEIIQAAVKHEIFDVKYDISSAKIRDAPPIIALSTAIRNDSDGPVNQTLTYTYEKSEVGTWNDTVGVTIGVKASFEAGVPFVEKGTWEVSVSGSYTHQWGGQVGKREMITSTTTVTVPPKKKARATVIIRNAHLDVEFSYREKILWSNGQEEEKQKKGIYRNVDSWFTDVKLDNWEDA